MKATFHVFSDGCGFVDLGPDARPQEVDLFKQEWDRVKVMEQMPTETLFIGGMEVTVVEHDVPFRKIEFHEHEWAPAADTRYECCLRCPETRPFATSR